MFSIFRHKCPFILLSFITTGGILWSSYFPLLSIRVYVYSTLLFLLCTIFTFSFSDNRFYQNLFFFLFLFSLVAFRNTEDIPTFQPGQNYTITGEYIGSISPDKLVIKSGKMTMCLHTPDSTYQPQTGDYFVFQAKLFPLASNTNPLEFDYNNYLRQQQINIRGVALSKLTHAGYNHSLFRSAQKVRKQLLTKLDKIVKDTTTLSFLQALCLGSKNNLSAEHRQLFQATGTVHLFAISGLHMGAIYLLIIYVLHLFGIKKEYGLIIPLIWFFTFVSGLSPSACRAASILTCISLGKLVNRDYIPLNAIGASAFFTLLLKPTLLYSVSFQMSYAAYTGIILIYPLLQPKHVNWPVLIRKIYSLLTLSLTAQIATIPLAAYYFHSITLNSVIINCIAIPLATLLLYGGILLLVLPTVIGSLVSLLISELGQFLVIILHEFNRITLVCNTLYPTAIHIVLYYLWMFAALAYLVKRKQNRRYIFYVTTIILFLFILGFTYFRQNRTELIIYHRYQNSTILLNYKGYYTYLKSSDTYIPNYVIAHRLKPIPDHQGFLSPNLQFKNNLLISPDFSLYITDKSNCSVPPVDFLIVTQNTFPDQIIHISSEKRLKKIILDGSNHMGCIKAWQKWGEKEKINLQITREHGSIRLRLK